MVAGTGDSELERGARPGIGGRLLRLAGLVMTIVGVLIFLIGVVNGDAGMWVWGLAFSLMGQGAQLPGVKR